MTDIDDIIDSDVEDERVFASPLAKRLAEDADIDLSSIEGTGTNGRITKADVERAICDGLDGDFSKNKSLVLSSDSKSGSSVSQSSLGSGAVYKDIPHSTMRKVIAGRLLESKQTIPHYYLTLDCDLEALTKMREELNKKAEELGLNYRLSVNDFVIKAAAMALRKVPGVNVSWREDALRMYNTVDISVAVATNSGLITPIVRNADRRRLPDISRNMKSLSQRAKDGKLMPEEYQGGNFTITNLGMFGIKNFSAIINPPQAAILAVGAAEQRIVIKNGAIAIAKQMTCTMSLDHRVVDGAVGAEFLSKFKQIIEEPLVLML